MLKGHGTKQRRLWWAAIRALVTEGGNVSAAADKVGVQCRTLRGWMKDKDFKRNLALAEKKFDEGQLEAIQEEGRKMLTA